MTGAVTALWPVVAGLVVLAIVALAFRQVRKRGQAEADRDHELEQGVRNDEAAKIRAEPIGDTGGWLARMRAKLPRKT